MRAIKKLSLTLSTITILGTVVLGSYNSMVVNNDAFMNVDSGIEFTKRLDEINGKITIGRMAASATPWPKMNQKKKETIKQKVVKVDKKVVKKEQKEVVQAEDKLPKPAINADLSLKVQNIFYKKPLKQGTFQGSAKTVDGIVEEIFVTFPDGRTIDINTRDRMVGNVFKYEDSQTREMKSGMIYEVKEGTYMITLTNDTQFPGVRLEFKAENASMGYNDTYYTAQESWQMDQQSNTDELADENIDSAPAYDYQDQRNDEVEYAQGYEETQAPTGYGFNFNS